MRSQRDLLNKNWVWAIVCPLIYIVILWNLVPFVYGIVDDRTMMEVVSGQYLGTPDVHMIFIGYWYSLFVAGLYTLIPNMEWYALCYLVLQGVCMGLVCYRMLSCRQGHMKKSLVIILTILWCAVLGVQITAQITFTTTAAVLAVTAIFWYMTTEEFHISELLILFMLCFLALQIRIVVFFMILPICGVLWLFRLLEGEKSKGHLVVPLFAAAALFLYLIGEILGYGSPEWRAFRHHIDNDTLVYDYGDYELPRYEDAQELYNSLGIESGVRVKNLYYYNCSADDGISPDFFEQYVEECRALEEEPLLSLSRLKTTIKNYVKGTVKGEYGYRHLIALLGYGLLIAWYGLKREWKQCLRTCCVSGVQILLWLYLIYRGRLPERVLICMNLMLIVPLLVLWMERLSCREILIRYHRAGAGILIVILCVSATWQTVTVCQANKEISGQNQDVEALKEYCGEHQENFYFNDVTSMAFSTWNVRLYYENTYKMNYISLGDWICYSPLWQQKLEQQGITSVKDALYTRDHVYLISSFDRGVEYLTNLYDNVTCTETDKIHGFRIYKLNLQ